MLGRVTLGVSPPTIRVRCTVVEARPVPLERGGLDAVRSDVRNTACDAVILVLCFGIVGQDVGWGPNGRELIEHGRHGFIVVNLTLLIDIWATKKMMSMACFTHTQNRYKGQAESGDRWWRTPEMHMHLATRPSTVVPTSPSASSHLFA